jgi:integrase
VVLERRDIDRAAGVLAVRRTISSGEVVELAKTGRSRRQVPLSERALAALDDIPPRLDTPYLFPARRGGPFDLASFRRREWAPAIEALGVHRPARVYDLRSTFASNALAAGESVFELARVKARSGPGALSTVVDNHALRLAPRAGLEPATRGLEGRRSIQLSYRGNAFTG